MDEKRRGILRKIFFMLIAILIAILIVAFSRTAQQALADQPDSTVQTLIITNRARLETLYGTGVTSNFFTLLNTLATHPVVSGKIIQVENISAVAEADTAWQSDLTNPNSANMVATAIKDVIVSESQANIGLKYVVLVGDDRVIPFHRIPDETPNINEKSYTQVPITTTVGAALAANLFLSDDFYADLQATTPITPYIPEIAIGRLLETPDEMTAAIQKFLSNNGEIRSDSGLIAGFDFIKDAAQFTCTLLSSRPTEAPLTNDCALIGDSWTASELDDKLLSSNAGLLFLYTHADHHQIGMPQGGVLTSERIASWNSPTEGRLVYNISDHSGLSVPPETTSARDWPQAWIENGAVYVANTGYAWGLGSAIGLAEKLGTNFAKNIIDGMPGIAVGDALIAAKRTYYQEDSDLSSYDRKTINELALYGLPMYKLVLPSGSHTPTPTIGTPPPTRTPTPTTQASQPGALIIVGGRLRLTDSLQANIHFATNAMYHQFTARGYGDERIYYMAHDATLPGFDATATITNVQTAITNWAVDKVDSQRYLTLYFMGHGAVDQFFVDKVNGQVLTPTQLATWLSQIESAVPGVLINIIIDQAFAGSFISQPQSISHVGRLVIASSGADQIAYASTNGAAFSDLFTAALTRGGTLDQAFQDAKSLTTARYPQQIPQLDGDGNGIVDEVSDQQVAQARILFAGVLEATPTTTWTPTQTASPTPSNTPTATPSRSPTPTATTANGSDGFENDNSCAQAHMIGSDGLVQSHTFHLNNDADWVKFNVAKGKNYQIDVVSPQDSLADVQLELYKECGGSSTTQDSLGPGVRLRFSAESEGVYFLKLVNYDPNVSGKDYFYQLSVRTLDDEPTTGALVIVAGRLRVNDPLQPNIYRATDNVYKLFLANGYSADRIYYLANDLNLDPDNSPITQDVDALATRDRLEYAITKWATDPKLGLGAERAFTLYMMDHGEYDTFYLNGRNETVDPSQVNNWLNILEGAAPGVKVNIFIDACKSGSFIDSDKSLSKPGRVVITSAASNESAYVSTDGVTVFTSPFVQALNSQKSLYEAYQEARLAGAARPIAQTIWLDDNGNGIANETSDGAIAQQRGFAFAGSLAVWDSEPPYIAWAEAPIQIENHRGTLRAKVQSDSKPLDVWATIYEPSYLPPPPGEELVLEALPTVRLEDADGDDIYSGIYAGFDDVGNYQIVIYAEDNQNLHSRPRSVNFQLGSKVYLPMVSR